MRNSCMIHYNGMLPGAWWFSCSWAVSSVSTTVATTNKSTMMMSQTVQAKIRDVTDLQFHLQTCLKGQKEQQFLLFWLVSPGAQSTSSISSTHPSFTLLHLQIQDQLDFFHLREKKIIFMTNEFPFCLVNPPGQASKLKITPYKEFKNQCRYKNRRILQWNNV